MKKLFYTLIVTLLALSTTSCFDDDGSDTIWDVYPLNFYIYVTDASGNNLLSENVANNILDQDIKIIFDQMEFPLDVDMNDVYTSRAYMPYMYGLQLSSERLVFGEFDGAMDHKDTFVISWGDGTYDDVTFEYDFEWGSGDGAPSSTKTIYLNDVKLSDPSAIRIVK